MAAAMDGLDALVFTGGVGENAAPIRERCCRGLGFLGVELDEAANRTASPDADVTGGDGKVRVVVVKAREDLAIFREVQKVRDGGGLDADAAESRGSPRAGA